MIIVNRSRDHNSEQGTSPTSQNQYTHEQLQSLTDAERLDVLREFWGCAGSKLDVWGRLIVVGPVDNRFVKLTEVRSVRDNHFLTYPGDVDLKIIERGLYIPQKYANELIELGLKYIQCEAELAPEKEREKHNNPLHVNVKIGSATELKELPISLREQLFETENALLLNEAVYEHYVGLKKQEVEELEVSLKAQLETSTGEAKSQLVNVQYQLVKVQDKQHMLLQENSRLEETISLLQSSQSEEAEKLIVLLETQEKAEKKMSQHLARLKNYIEDKATLLRQLEFIDAEEFESLLTRQPEEREGLQFMNFDQDLGRDYKQAVSYIQAYLLEQDIIYPRHVLENFFALLRTQDLIVLAGDSGSGKTNLVQSFAQAIGGVAKIIPVKPNWTSSEDLLGYYNPLEKKYLATPFLEALIEAKNHPEVPYLICLDEMNLARVEYYFADFLSKLEQRNEVPEIVLFSDNESAHVLSELSQVMEIIRGAKDKYQKNDVVNFVRLLQDEELNAELRRAFGFSDQDSLIKYHSDIRRMLAGVMNTPSSVSFPPNVRIIGSINIDETTHYLSPKILDRVHVMKFTSPLLTDWQTIIDEVEGYEFESVDKPLRLDINDLGLREPYPKFDQNDPFCRRFVELNREYFHPIGVEFGLRTIRQGLNFIKVFSSFNQDNDLAINNFVLHKVLPKLTFDGNKEISGVTKLDLLFGLAANLDNTLQFDVPLDDAFSVKILLQAIANKAKANDGIVNYWA